MNYLILALATYRLSYLIANEDGPLNLILRFRRLIGVDTNQHGLDYGKNNFAIGWICIYCNSIWIGALMAAAYFIWSDIIIWIMLPFALSAGAIIVNNWTDNNG